MRQRVASASRVSRIGRSSVLVYTVSVDEAIARSPPERSSFETVRRADTELKQHRRTTPDAALGARIGRAGYMLVILCTDHLELRERDTRRILKFSSWRLLPLS
jgi:hypothetical protein